MQCQARVRRIAQCRLPGYAQSEEDPDNNTIIPLHLFEMASYLLLHWSFFFIPPLLLLTYFCLSVFLSFFSILLVSFPVTLLSVFISLYSEIKTLQSFVIYY